MDNKELYKKAIEKWGKESQIRQLFEEMSELTVAICHFERGRNFADQGMLEIVEEIADVEIMLEQMKQLYNLSEELIEAKKVKKLSKLKKMLEDD